MWDDICLRNASGCLFHNVDARQTDAVFLNFCNHFNGNILCNDKTVAQGKATQQHFIAKSCNGSLLFLGIGICNFVVVQQLIDAVVCCCIDIQIQQLFQLGDGVCFCIRKGIRSSLCDGKRGLDVDVVLFQQISNGKQNGIGFFQIIREFIRFDDYVVSHFIFNNGVALCIHNFSTCGRNGLGIGIGGSGTGCIACTVYHLDF